MKPKDLDDPGKLEIINTKKQYDENIAIIQEILENEKIKTMGKHIREKLKRKGFKIRVLGTGKTAKYHSKDIICGEILSIKYVRGNFLGIALGAKIINFKTYYFGMIKEVDINKVQMWS